MRRRFCPDFAARRPPGPGANFRSRVKLCSSLSAAGFLVIAGAALGQGGFGASENETSGGLDSMTVESENPDSLTVGSEDPDSLTVGTRALPAAVAPESPTPQAGTGASPDALTVGTESLSDSPEGPGLYGNVQNPAASPDLVPDKPQSLAQARAMLRRAQARLASANTAVGNMMERDYPRGQPRIDLYDEKKSAEADVAQAQEWVQGFGGSPGEGMAP